MSRRAKVRPSGDRAAVHAQIQREAGAVQANPLAFVADPSRFPALDALFRAAAHTVEAATPAAFEHEGRRYWLRVGHLGIILSIFDAPANRIPLIAALTHGPDAGHKPGH